MVLTNFECWAHGGSDDLSANLATERRTNSVDLFNPGSALDQSCNTPTDVVSDGNMHIKSISHLSSNGYYGFVPFTIENNLPEQNNTLTLEKNTVIKQNDNNKCDDDTIMDVEQQPHGHVIFEHSIRATSDRVVGSMFPNDKTTVLAQFPTLKRKCGNYDCDLNRRKRIMEDQCDEAMGMDFGMIKKTRYGFTPCITTSDAEIRLADLDNIHPSDMKDSTMDQDDLTTLPSSDTNTILNSSDSQHITQSMTGRQCFTNKLRVKNTNPKTIFSDKIEEANFKPNKLLKPTENAIDLPNNIDIETKIKYESITNGINSENLTRPNHDDHDDLYHESDVNFKTTNENDDNLLENLFLSLHGGSNHHLWQHLSNEMCCNEV